jgi:hypothetical protein
MTQHGHELPTPIASRMLHYADPAHPNRHNLTITVYTPEKSSEYDEWDCRYSIQYSDGYLIEHVIHGEDSMQALLLTFQVIRGYLDSLSLDGAVIEWLSPGSGGFPRVVFD